VLKRQFQNNRAIFLATFLIVGCINTTYAQDEWIKVLYPNYEPEYATGAPGHKLMIHPDQQTYASKTACSKAVAEVIRQNPKDQKVRAIPVCRTKVWYDAYLITFSRRSNSYWDEKIAELESKLKMVDEGVENVGTTTAESQRAQLIREAYVKELSWMKELRDKEGSL
jgi:hypothetical protein